MIWSPWAGGSECRFGQTCLVIARLVVARLVVVLEKTETFMVDRHPADIGNALVAKVGRMQRLAVFEAVARHGSLTKAARELGVTQPGLSRQIAELERSVGLSLFERGANRITLTDVGQVLLDAVQEGFRIINSTAERLAYPDSFVLAVNPGIAERWLIPRIDGVRSLFDCDLRLWLFDRDQELVNGRFDLAIHLGAGPWPDYRVRRIYDEVVMPVASSEFAENHGLTESSVPNELVGVDLLCLDTTDRSWMSWDDWFSAHDVGAGQRTSDSPTLPTDVVYNNYALVIQAALGGRGVALGWEHLADELIAAGLLRVVGPKVVGVSAAYHLIWPESTPEDIVDSLFDWLMVSGL